MKKTDCKTECRTYYNAIEKLNELREIADKIIYFEEWNKLDTARYNSEEFLIENQYNGKSYRITTRDTEETLRAAIEELSRN